MPMLRIATALTLAVLVACAAAPAHAKDGGGGGGGDGGGSGNSGSGSGNSGSGSGNSGSGGESGGSRRGGGGGRSQADIVSRVGSRVPGDVVGVRVDRNGGGTSYNVRVIEKSGRVLRVHVNSRGEIFRVEGK